jgi:hypothetical protein
MQKTGKGYSTQSVRVLSFKESGVAENWGLKAYR